MKAPLATPRARALAAALREARTSRGIGQRELARLLGMTHPLLSHWERGMRLPRVEDVASILACLRVTGPEKEQILDLARNAGEANWLEQSMPGLPTILTALMECDRTTSDVTVWNPELIPGPLQTSEYSRAIFEADSTSADQIEPMLMIRMARRDVLTCRNPPSYSLLLGSSSLRQGIGGGTVMAAQLRHLLTSTRLKNFSLRVVPAGVGWHAGLMGPFTVYEFPDLPPIVLAEHHRGSAYLYDEGYIADYRAAVITLQNLALGEQDSLALITEVIAELEASA